MLGHIRGRLRECQTMPHIELIGPDDAEGALLREYEAALRRAGRLWNIVSIQCHTPAILQASMHLYQVIMHGPSPLSRAQREMLAVVTSQVNECHY